MIKLETNQWIFESDGELTITHKFSGCKTIIREVEDEGDNFDHLIVEFDNAKHQFNPFMQSVYLFDKDKQ